MQLTEEKKDILKDAYAHLTSRKPEEMWTSGQWVRMCSCWAHCSSIHRRLILQKMTERKGGSDVATGTQTVASPEPNGSYALRGYKWFTSATGADMAFTLARIEKKDHTVQLVDLHRVQLGAFLNMSSLLPRCSACWQGSRGLSCFFLRVRQDDGSLNNIRIVKLKNKLGTKQLPTAELEVIDDQFLSGREKTFHLVSFAAGWNKGPTHFTPR